MTEHRVVVVLGKNWSHRPFRLSIESKMGAIAAGELYLRGTAQTLIFSGGRTAGRHRPSEAEAMLAFMRRFFRPEVVPVDAVILESQAIDTAGNAQAVRDLLPLPGPTRISLLTVGFHGPAARTLFENFGVRVEDVCPSEQILLRRSAHYSAFVRRWNRSPRVTVAKAQEMVRRILLMVDPKGRIPRLITRVSRGR